MSRSEYLDASCLSPFSKEKTDAFPVVRPTNTLCNCGANINGDKLFAQVLMLFLWNGVRDLKYYKSRIVKKHTSWVTYHQLRDRQFVY